jgi:hypothetical protein
LTALQESMLLLNAAASDGVAYNMAFAITIRPHIRPDRLDDAIKRVLGRHDQLRSTFHRDVRDPYRLVEDGIVENCHRFDGTGMSVEQVRSTAQDFVHRRFELDKTPPIRILLIGRADESVLVLAVHHIASDLRSLGALLDDLITLLVLPERRLPAVEESFADYVRDERHWLSSAKADVAREYWTSLLSGVDSVFELPSDLARPDGYRPAGDTVAFALADDSVTGLRATCRRHGVTPFIFLLGSYAVLLGRHGGRQEFLLGVTFDTRRRRSGRVIGPFVNTMPVKARISGESTFAETLAFFAAQVADSVAYADYPFSRIPADLGLSRDSSRPPLVQVLMSMLTIRPDSTVLAALAPGSTGGLSMAGHRFERFDLRQQEGQFDLGLDVFDTRHAIQGRLKFNPAVITREAAERLARHYATLIDAAIRDPLTPVGVLPMMDRAERETVLSFSAGGS